MYQIRDDYCNLKDDKVFNTIPAISPSKLIAYQRTTKYKDLKGFADDLTEGKFSFPVIHSIHADDTNQEILGI